MGYGAVEGCVGECELGREVGKPVEEYWTAGPVGWIEMTEWMFGRGDWGGWVG